MPPRCILHVPHASVEIPADLRVGILLSDDALDVELLRMTDRYTDGLFMLPPGEAATVRFPVSRLVVDPERFVDDAREPMAARGMGVIYTRTSDGRPLRDPPADEERHALLRRFYEPHHRALDAAAGAALDAHGSCLIVDCHSFPSVALPCDLDQSPGRPDICIGTDPFHTPRWFAELAAERFTAAGWAAELDRPYRGALVPEKHFGKDRRVAGIMVEVNRALYMDEGTGVRRPDFEEVAGIVQATIRELIMEYPPARGTAGHAG